MRHGLNLVGLGLLAIAFSQLMWLFLAGSISGNYALLGLAYALFLLPFALSYLRRCQPWRQATGLFCFTASFGMVGILLFKRPHLEPLYPLGTTLAYLILLVLCFGVVNRWIFSKPHTMRFHFQKRYLLYGLGLIILLLATYTMDRSDPFGPHFQLRVVVWLLLALLIVNWFLGQWRMVKALEAAHSQTELLLLKSQIQPHFLFNTLNNLYGLAREGSDQTAEMILRLSELLRYGLYQANQERVELAKEVDYLENFIALQTLRHAGGVAIETKVAIEPGSWTISPLMLIPLMENAFKHGADRMAEGATIAWSLTVAKGTLCYRVENSVPNHKEDHQPGVGLENLTKRLALVYPDRHQFTFSEERTHAHAELSIEL